MSRAKPPETRQRMNKSVTAATLTESGAAAPELPVTIRCEETRTWWQDIWASPMAAQWLTSDRHALLRLSVLVDQFWTAPTKELAADIAKQEARFGLTPYDRHRMQWKVEAASDKPVLTYEEAGEDPRARLRAVK